MVGKEAEWRADIGSVWFLPRSASKCLRVRVVLLVLLPYPHRQDDVGR
jgi:hypothetical protein